MAETYGFVYFLRAEGLGLIKIGSARDPIKRLATLRTGCPDRLSLMGVIPANDRRELESSLHRHFRGNRSHGEWFHLTERLAEYIKENTSPMRTPRPRRAVERIREAVLRRRAEEAAAAA